MFVHYQIKTIMKNRLTLIIAFLTFFAFTSCEDEPLTGNFLDETGVDGSDSGASSFFANVNGVEFIDTVITTSTIDNGTVEYISITAVNDMNEVIEMSIPVAHIVGSYSFTQSLMVTSVSGSYLVGGDTLTSLPGTLFITEKTASSITGVFSFTASPTTGIGTTYDVTDGTFSVVY